MTLTKILIVDDDREFRELIIFALRFTGLFAFGAASGDECLSLARLHMPDLILLDYDLHNINSNPVDELLKVDEKTASIPVIMLFEKSLQSEIQATNFERVSGFINKSESPDNITRQVIRYLLKAKKPNP